MAQAAVAEGLAGSLLKVVSDPVHIAVLYEILGEYCHQLRNRLNSLKLSLYLAKRSGSASDAWTDLEQQYRQIEGFIEQVQVVCRPMPLAPVLIGLDAVIEDRHPTWQAWLAARGRSLELVAPREAAVGCFDPTRLTQGLDALAAWRSRAGPQGCPVRLRWWAVKHELRLSWHEPRARDLVSATPHPDLPASLALPVLARVVASHGGSFAISCRNGLRFNLRWPREIPSEARSSNWSTT
ncbi:MAG TPA: hypothetical protein VGZ22_16260 [Isosphaeraceae bacterium]|jgi:hypothetical protein|nr:hypothetical protein [Isosphaeraceae bacterium]